MVRILSDFLVEVTFERSRWSMSWIKIDTTLVNKPEVVKMARLLKVTRVTLLGYLVKLKEQVNYLKLLTKSLVVTL
jgi:hypothetical protein